MPGLVTMKPALKPRGTCSKAVARAKEERGLGALLSQVRVSPAKKGRRPSDLQALGALTRSNLAMKLRMKLLGEGGDDDDETLVCEPSSVRLAAMVDEFLEDETNDRKRGRSRFDDAPSDENSKSSELVAVLHSNVDIIPERTLFAEVRNAVAAVNMGSYFGDGVTSYLKRHVMRHLRRAGFNAGICKAKWDHLGGFPGGEYEYIDVEFEYKRIVIDVDFKAQFEIARPTPHYDALVQVLPEIFVGRADQLQWIVNVMSEAVQVSLKKRGMHLPPWRKPEYMRAKWFSSYRRTTNWDKASIDGVSLVANKSVQSSDVEPDEKPVVKESIENAVVSNSIDNNDWQLPILNARKSHGPGHAGLASLFRKPVASVNEGKDLVMVA